MNDFVEAPPAPYTLLNGPHNAWVEVTRRIDGRVALSAPWCDATGTIREPEDFVEESEIRPLLDKLRQDDSDVSIRDDVEPFQPILERAYRELQAVSEDSSADVLLALNCRFALRDLYSALVTFIAMRKAVGTDVELGLIIQPLKVNAHFPNVD